jgi:hypothetical protein
MIHIEVRAPAITLGIMVVEESLPAVERLPAYTRGGGLGIEALGPGVDHSSTQRACAPLELDVHRVVD